jgi:D-amino-acid oxidase
MRVIVVGAGVVGLSCGVRLAEAGFEVHVQARDLPLETTSAVAAALWYPYRAYPRDAVDRWGRATYTELVRLADDPDTAVVVRSGTEVLRRRTPDPWWAGAVPALQRLAGAELPEGYADGWRFPAPLVDMPRYLTWLVQRLHRAGGSLTRMSLPALPDAPLVVNCTGLAARALARDPSVEPVRGQTVLVEQFGLDEWWLDGSDESVLTYVVPRTHEVVVGGTALEGSWDRDPDEATARAILERASRLVPALRSARVIGARVGLRPGRPVVRLETVHRAGGAVVHCYGHGGAGVTLSWGCADDVLTEVRRLAAVSA